MTEQAVAQIVAVVVGGFIAIAGGFVTTILVDRQRHSRESRNLALAFKGEITALLTHAKERGYRTRIAEVIRQIEATQAPFYMPMRIRFRYDRVYDSNVERIGMLTGALPELIPLFYTRLTSFMEDMIGLADGTYQALDLPVLLRVYRDLDRILDETITAGERIIQEIDTHYH